MLNRLFDRVLISLAGVAAALVIYTTLSVVFEVVMRYFFHRPTRWVVDFTEYALLFILFLAAAWVLSKEGHIKIDILLEALSPKVQRVLNITTSLVGAGACAVFFWFSLWMTWEAFVGGDILWKATILPKWPIWIIMPFGSLFLTLQFLRRAWLYARRNKVPGKGKAEIRTE